MPSLLIVVPSSGSGSTLGMILCAALLAQMPKGAGLQSRPRLHQIRALEPYRCTLYAKRGQLLSHLRTALRGVDIPFLGFVQRDTSLELLSRHLALYLAHKQRLPLEHPQAANKNLDLGGLRREAKQAPTFTTPLPPPQITLRKRKCVAMATDKWFCFFCQENSDALERAGAVLRFSRPLCGQTLSDGLGGIYLDGGYPELFVAQLSQNRLALSTVHRFKSLTCAECGGRMYLSQAFCYEGERYQGADKIPRTARTSRTSALKPGYWWLKVLKDGHVVKTGMGFNSGYTSSTNDLFQSLDVVYQEDYATRHVHAHYVHLFYPTNPELASTTLR